MLRMIFTAEDLCRVRVARSAQPTQELILSINSLRVLTSPPRRSAAGEQRS
ncbi:hypothetical protein SAMN05421854_103143 [Amycolatopsis rubida]|uniref:Uncharacterized protein n=1 Tax=Amycolatopsis rubida TaxID=112413 RepID=A0A1I5KDT1_9PSEU|nr:hypothetical protein SAMN05421854_103143 [Amycolatopsis rubida]